MSENSLNTVVEFLQANPVQFLATVGLDGKPRVRPFQFMLADSGKLWFCTGAGKNVFAELNKFPYVELSAASPAFAWIRLSGKAVFSDDPDMKNRIVAQSDLVRNIYGSGDNPEFAAFYIDGVKATLADFSGNPPRHFG